MKFRLNETWVNDDTVNVLPAGAVALTDVDWRNRKSAPYVKTPADIAAEESAKAKADMDLIDLSSIRAIREYIAAKVDAPQTLKDREAAAIAARVKL